MPGKDAQKLSLYTEEVHRGTKVRQRKKQASELSAGILNLWVHWGDRSRKDVKKKFRLMGPQKKKKRKTQKKKKKKKKHKTQTTQKKKKNHKRKNTKKKKKKKRKEREERIRERIHLR